MDDELRQSLEDLARRQKETLDALEKSSKQKKTLWDYIQPTFLITLVGALLTWNIQLQQTRVQQLQTVEKFMPHLTAGLQDVDRQQVAIAAIATLVSEEFAIRLASRVSAPGAARAVDRFFSAAQTGGGGSGSFTSPPTQSERGRDGWVYLGDYDTNAKTWRRRYFKFSVSDPPDSFVGQTLEVGNPLNVRQGMPATDASFSPVVDVLRPGSKVVVLEVRPWQSTGFMWGRVSYIPRKE